jgi:transcriptional regulator with XRE-family HTH domain
MAIPSTVRKRLTQAQRELILKDYQESQLTQAEFAERAGISVSTLQLWLRKYSASTPPQAQAFVEVPNLLGQVSTAPMYRIELGSGIRLELSWGFKPEELALLLELLRA